MIDLNYLKKGDFIIFYNERLDTVEEIEKINDDEFKITLKNNGKIHYFKRNGAHYRHHLPHIGFGSIPKMSIVRILDNSDTTAEFSPPNKLIDKYSESPVEEKLYDEIEVSKNEILNRNFSFKSTTPEQEKNKVLEETLPNGLKILTIPIKFKIKAKCNFYSDNRKLIFKEGNYYYILASNSFLYTEDLQENKEFNLKFIPKNSTFSYLNVVVESEIKDRPVIVSKMFLQSWFEYTRIVSNYIESLSFPTIDFNPQIKTSKQENSLHTDYTFTIRFEDLENLSNLNPNKDIELNESIACDYFSNTVRQYIIDYYNGLKTPI